MTLLNANQWDNFLKDYPQAHILQTSAWGMFKSSFGWKTRWVQSGAAGAQVLFYHLPLGFSVAYIPKGPVGETWGNLWPEIDALCQKEKSVFLKVEPDIYESEGGDLKDCLPGFLPGCSPIQPRRTLLVNLKGSEEDWLSRMKPKTRYNIHLAARKGVKVKESQDLGTFYRLMRVTGERNRFGVHSQDYYQRAFQLFIEKGNCVLLQAEFQGEPLAAVMIFQRGTRAWYFYGESSDKNRNLMPTYLLQWEAIRWAAQKGCLEYDLWGVPDFEEEALEKAFSSRNDNLWGVYRFKRGFGGQLVRSVGAWDKIYHSLFYRLYLWRTGRKSGALV